MKTPFKSINAQQTYTTRLMVVKEFMDSGHEIIYLCLLTNGKFKSQIKKIWCHMVISLINDYGKDMILLNVRWAINDVKVKAFGSKNQTTWHPKVLLGHSKNIHNYTNHL